jgi:type I restriction enzyme R subunit
MKEVVKKLSELTDNFNQLPPSEKAQDDVFDNLKEYNRLLSQLKQYTKDDDGNPISAYDNPQDFYKRIGISEQDEIILTTVIAGELKERRAIKENIDISNVDLSMLHIHNVTINYDYLVDLIAQMAIEIYDNMNEEAQNTRKEIDIEIAKSDSNKEKIKLSNFVSKIFNKEFKFKDYPDSSDVEIMNQAMESSQNDTNMSIVTNFIRKWGLGNNTNPKDLENLFKKHRKGYEDLDKQGELSAIMNGARINYQEIADTEIKNLEWVQYRIALRDASYEVAEKIEKGE